MYPLATSKKIVRHGECCAGNNDNNDLEWKVLLRKGVRRFRQCGRRKKLEIAASIAYQIKEEIIGELLEMMCAKCCKKCFFEG